jgi:hypothetical protein
MLPNSLKTRGVTFAFLAVPPRFVSREEGAQVYNSLCERLAYDDITFRYSTVEPTAKPLSKGFTINCERKEGRGAFQVNVSNQGVPTPTRLLMSYTWPPSPEHVKQVFNSAADAVFGCLSHLTQKIVAEVRIRAQCETKGGNGLAFIRDRLLRLDKACLESLGTPLAFGSVKLEVAASHPIAGPLDNPKRELTVEVLREEPGALYVELICQWAQVPIGVSPGLTFDVGALRPIQNVPSEYVAHSQDFLVAHLATLACDRS